jgi:hypothetical protein
MLISFALPVLLTGVALFFASFLSWMVLQLHKADWHKLPKNEDGVLEALRASEAPYGSYMIPGADSTAERETPEFKQKLAQGMMGVFTRLRPVNMGRNLLLTFVMFQIVTWTIAYLSTIALPAGSSFLDVFRFAFTTALLAYLTSIVQHSIWFQNRIVGHVIEALGYATITGLIFASFWPAAQ